MTIQAQHITVTPAGAKRPILDAVSCQIEAGKLTLLLGKTGSGKSTLLQALSGLQPLTSGDVYFDDSPLWTNGKLNKSLLLWFGHVFQYPEQQLFARTVQKEFDYSLRPYRVPKSELGIRADQALTDIGLSLDVKERSPFELSHGQKRRTALATTFATDANWMFLDEPTSGLDAEANKRLLTWLEQRKREQQQSQSGGIIVATHDLETFWRFADHVLIMRDGKLIASMSPAQLAYQPAIWEKSGILPPVSVLVGQQLTSQGAKLPHGSVTPAELADHIADRLQRNEGKPIFQHDAFKQAVGLASLELDSSQKADSAQGEVDNNSEVEEVGSAAKRLAWMRKADPRAKWLVYMLWSVIILFQKDWLSIGVSTLWTFITIGLAGLHLRKLLRLAAPFLILIVLSFVFSGIRFGEAADSDWHAGWIHFALSPSLVTVFNLWQILLVMLLGMVLAQTTSSLKMKQGIEYFLGLFRWMRVPVESIALAASLIFRFIPVMMKEANRFAMIASARGKQPSKSGRIHLRSLSAMMLPMMMSLFQYASDISLALESKGFRTHGHKRRHTPTGLQMRAADYKLMGWGAAVGVIMIWLSIFMKIWFHN